MSKISPSTPLYRDSNFLNLHWGREKGSHLLYLGGNRGHLPILARLYPQITFHLYGEKREGTSNIVYHKEEFTLETAASWGNSSKIIPLYLISQEPDEKICSLSSPRQALLYLEK